MYLYLDAMQAQIEKVYELDEIVECGELVECVPGGKPFMQDQIETTYYWVKDCNGKEFKMLVPPYMMWAYKFVGLEKAKEMTEDYFYHQVVVLNELMCKIFGVDEFNERDELRCCCLDDVTKVWKYAMFKYHYTGEFKISENKYMFGKEVADIDNHSSGKRSIR